MFVSAVLLFVVQPMFAKMVLPQLGGTPAVWNTCVLFFQATLLLGYLYVHVTAQRLGLRRQVQLHLFVLLLPLLALPIALRSGAPPQTVAPVWWLLGVLIASVGLPFFVVSTTAPLLQRWFSALPHPSARDPYFLYAASNMGSLIGLLGYPFLIERMLPLVEQSTLWAVGYGLTLLLVVGCGAVLLRSRSGAGDGDSPATLDRHEPFEESGNDPVPTSAPWRRRLMWLALSFVPSSLLLGVTTYISTDVAAVPLLWVIPLALYLLTFILAFASRPPISRLWTTRLAPFLVAGVLATIVFEPRNWWVLVLHLVAFFAVALVCHRELAERRPPVRHLTGFYLWISLGGALGGAFNTLVAPFLFTSIAEYPLVLALAAFLRPPPAWRGRGNEPWRFVAGLPSIALIVVVAAWWAGALPEVALKSAVMFVLTGAAVALAIANRVEASAFALLALAVVYVLPGRTDGARVLYAARSFFGVHRVLQDTPPTKNQLTHGTTLHGWQALDARERCEPSSYYHRSGPIGQLFTAMGDRAVRVGVVGLGAGGLACHARPGSTWTFFEIDPTVEQIARNEALFTFVAKTPAKVNVVIGDGRLTLAAAPPASFDVVVVDAFSSDAIPMHLVTEESIRLGVERLRPGGLLAFHISNRYLNLEPVLAAAARNLSLIALEQYHQVRPSDAVPSRWIVMARDARSLGALATDGRWRQARPGTSSWTDDFSNILDVVAWSHEAAVGSR